MSLASEVGDFLEVPPPPSLWTAVGKLLMMRMRIAVRGFARAKRARKIGYSILALFLLAAIGGMFYLIWQGLRLLQSPELVSIAGELTALLEMLPILVMSALFVGIFMTSFSVLLQALYLSGDMDFLLTTPVPIRAVFIAKLLQAVLPNFALTCLFVLPLLYGLGASYDYSLLYYPMVLVELSALALAAAGLSALLVMAIVRVFPARRVAEVLGFVGAISSIVCSQTGQIMQWNQDGMENVDPNQMLAAFDSLNSNWSPLAWAGRGLTALGRGEWLSGLGLTGLTLLLAFGLFYVSLITAERLYYSGWAGMQNITRRKKERRPAASSADGQRPSLRTWAGRILLAGAAILPTPIQAVIGKDWLVLRRDLKNLSQLITPMIFGIIYAISLLRSGGVPAEQMQDTPAFLAQAMANAQTYISVGLSLFVGWMLLGRLAGMGFSQERRSYWLVQTAPVSAGYLLTAKFIVAYLPALLLSLLYLLAITLLQGASLGALIYSLLTVTLLLAGNTGINLAFGIAGANMAWEDPRQMQRTGSSCLGALVVMLYMPLMMVLFFVPPLVLAFFGLPELLGQAIGLLIGGLVSLLSAIVPPLMMRKKVSQLGMG